MPQDGNAYQGLAPEMKLKLFLFETERFITSIIGYAELLKTDARSPQIKQVLSPDFTSYLEALHQAGWKLVRIIKDAKNPDDALVSISPPLETLAVLANETGGLFALITGYSTLLKQEVNKPNVQPYLSRDFLDKVRMIETASDRLAKTRQELFDSLKQPPPTG